MANLNDMARKITKAEGGKVNLSIAQVKEVLRLTLKELKGLTLREVAELLMRS